MSSHIMEILQDVGYKVNSMLIFMSDNVFSYNGNLARRWLQSKQYVNIYVI